MSRDRWFLRTVTASGLSLDSHVHARLICVNDYQCNCRKCLVIALWFVVSLCV